MKGYDDPRVPLKEGTILISPTHPIQVGRLIARGTSCLVYLATQDQNSCVLKQLYPEGMAHRHELIWNSTQMAQSRSFRSTFHYCVSIHRFKHAYHLQKKLFSVPVLHTSIVEVSSFFRESNTWYVVSPKKSGTSWDQIRSESPEQIIEIGIKIAELVGKLHKNGWLMVDIKDSNFLLDTQGDGKVLVRIADFDSMIPLERCKYRLKYRCSNATSSPELILKNRLLVGRQSDVYGIAAMLMNKLASIQVQASLEDVFASRISQRLLDWDTKRQTLMYNVLKTALETNPRKRYATCEELALALSQVRDFNQ